MLPDRYSITSEMEGGPRRLEISFRPPRDCDGDQNRVEEGEGGLIGLGRSCGGGGTEGGGGERI